MRRRPLLLLPLLAACLSASPEASNVRVTENPEVVRGCEFKGNVQAMSSWDQDGPRIIVETLKERTHRLGGNVVYVRARPSQYQFYKLVPEGNADEVGSGSGEAYFCPAK